MGRDILAIGNGDGALAHALIVTAGVIDRG
jgi:hypothetical protein